jgi:hypothetical protein
VSVAEILHQIEALPTEERLQLTEKLVQLAEGELQEPQDCEMTQAEILELERRLKQRPNLGAELARKIDRMQAGRGVDFEDIKALHEQMTKLGL